LEKLNKLVQIEWEAQKIVKNTPKTGPKIEVIFHISQQMTHKIPKKSHFLIMQGSFDPPTVTHIEILKRAVKLKKSFKPEENIEIIILLSISHVDKRLNVMERSLLGYRIEMLQLLLKEVSGPEFKFPITLGLSNVARYIDLIEGIRNYFQNIKSITFIMGMDVFKKVLEPKYYAHPLSKVLPQIFQANYYVAGREDIIRENEFMKLLKDRISNIKSVQDKIFFINMPEHARFLSATLLRKKIAKEGINKETNIHSVISNYLIKNSLYCPTKEELAILIAIQTVVRLNLETEKSKMFTLEILNQLIPEIKNNYSFQTKIVVEYKREEYHAITRRWAELQTQNSY
jgi:nicotinic acid mononucleotide adenylyltransferase